MSSDPDPAGWSRLSFLLEVLEDLGAGELPPLSRYLARHPGYEDAATQEYLALAGTGSSDGDAGAGRADTVARARDALVREFVGLTPDGQKTWLARIADLDESLSVRIERHQTRIEQPASAGASIGHYRLKRLLGRGGMGQVWEAHDTKLGRDVALKLLNSSTPNERSLLFFEREARAAARLRHPGIVAVFEANEADGQHYIAMELVDGGRTFATELEETTERPEGYHEQQAALFADVCDALEVAHGAGVIHRDLKPQNILIDPSGRAKVTDFGLAKIVDERSLSQIGEIAGSYFYMSPEQVTLRHIGLDHRTDVFSLGAVLYEALTFTRPFKGDTAQQIARNILFADPPEPHTIASRVPPELAVICAKALEKRPSDRFDSMAAFGADLRRYLAHEPILTKPPGRAKRALRWAQRHPVASSAGSVALFALGVVSVLSAFLWIANDLLEVRTIEAEEHSYVNGIRLAETDEMLALGALETCPRHLRNWEWGYLYLRANPSLASLHGHTDSISRVVYSPNGELIASASYDGTVRLWDGESGGRIGVLAEHTDAVIDLAFSVDGTQLVSASRDATLRVWDVASGTSVELSRHKAHVTVLAVAPDGLHFASGDAEGGLFLWSFADLDGMRLDGHDGRIQVAEFDSTSGKLVTGGHDEVVRVWSVEDGTRLHQFQGDASKGQNFMPITAVAFDPGARRVVSGSMGGKLRLWDLEQNTEQVRPAHRLPISVARFSPDGTHILSASWGGIHGMGWWRLWSGDLPIPTWTAQPALTLWSASMESPLALEGHTGDVTAAAFSADGQVVASVALDRVLRLFDANTGDRISELRGHRADPTSLAFRPDGKRLVSGDVDGGLLLWDAATGEPVRVLEGHERHVDRVDFSGDGSLAFSASFDGSVRVWNGLTGEPGPTAHVTGRGALQLASSTSGACVACSRGEKVYLWTHGTEEPALLGEHAMSVQALAFGAQDRLLLSSDLAQELIVRDVESREVLKRLRGVTGAFTPDGSLLAVWLESGAIELRTTQRFELVDTLEGHSMAGVAMAFTEDGSRLATGSWDETARLWDVEHGTPIAPLPASGPVNSIAFNADGTRLVSVTAYEVVARLDGATGEALPVLNGHTDRVDGARFAPDGKRVLSWSMDRTLRLWDASDGEALLTLTGHSGQIYDARFSPDGQRILSGAHDGEIRLWYSDPEQARSMWSSQ